MKNFSLGPDEGRDNRNMLTNKKELYLPLLVVGFVLIPYLFFEL